ncbi:BioY family protein [Uruburuella suis]|uniref:BioY family protein n=1 Tax=Uruburuella suis TaxID=252130 RepID=UPI002491718E|nr:BioY family protein [Uruburuella suis]
MKDIVLMGLFILGKLGFAWLAYLAVLNEVRYAGWFVFLAILYAVGTSLKVD